MRAAALVGSMLMAPVVLGVAVPAATAAAPAGYAPGSPAGSEYREQLASARGLGARDRAGPRGDSGSAGGPALFGVGITADDGSRAAGAGAANGNAATPRSAAGATPRTATGERSAIAAAARAPLDGPSSSLITGLFVVAALLATGLLTRLLRGRHG